MGRRLADTVSRGCARGGIPLVQLLTIITITKDDPAGLARTLASTAGWRAEAWVEQIVVDGSTVAVRLDERRVRVLEQKSKGIAGAFNEGLASARGEWIWFVNGGDEIDPRLQAEWLHGLLDRTMAGVVIGGTTFPGATAPRPPPPPKWQWPPFVPWIPHPSTLVRRSLFARHGGFDPGLAIAMDFEWWLRALSGDVVIDQVSLPFAVFAPGGVSLREEMCERTRSETSTAVWRHRGALLRSWAGITRRFFVHLGKACWRRSRGGGISR